AYSIVIGSKHITLNATGGGFLTASKQFRHGATSKSRSNTASKDRKSGSAGMPRPISYAVFCLKKKHISSVVSPLYSAKYHSLVLYPISLYTTFHHTCSFFFSKYPNTTTILPSFPTRRSSDLANSIVIGSKHTTLNATGGGFLTASKQFRHGATSKSRSNTAS